MLEIERLKVALSKNEVTSAQHNDYDAAINQLNANDLFLTGFALLNAKKYRSAINTFSKAIELGPTNPEAYINRGVAYEQLGLYDLALKDYTLAAHASQEKQVPRVVFVNYPPRGNPRVDIMRGLLYEKMGEKKATVLAEYDAAIQAEPLYAEAYYRKGNYLFKMSGYKLSDDNTRTDVRTRLFRSLETNRGKNHAYLKSSISNLEIAAKLGHKKAAEALSRIRTIEE